MPKFGIIIHYYSFNIINNRIPIPNKTAVRLIAKKSSKYDPTNMKSNI